MAFSICCSIFYPSWIKRVEENEQTNSIENREDISINYFEYAKIVRAQLGPSEQMLIFYHGLCFDEHKSLIQKFELLQNLSSEDLVDTIYHKDLYS